MKTPQVIQAVIELLGHPDCWTTGALARSFDGTQVEPLDQSAVKWSVPGACHKVSGGPEAWELVRPCLMAFRPALGANGAEITHELVIERLRGALLVSQVLERFEVVRK